MPAFIASLFTGLVSGVPALLRAQKRAARIILQADCSTSSVSLFSTLHWIPVCDIIKYNKLQLLFSILLNPEAPLCLKEKFSFVSANSAHMTRGATSGNLVVPQPQTNSGKYMFSFSAAILFNALPLEIKQLVRTPLVSLNALISFSAFLKHKLRELFIQKLNSIAYLEVLCCFACVFCFTAIAISPNRPSLLSYIVCNYVNLNFYIVLIFNFILNVTFN